MNDCQNGTAIWPMAVRRSIWSLAHAHDKTEKLKPTAILVSTKRISGPLLGFYSRWCVRFFCSTIYLIVVVGNIAIRQNKLYRVSTAVVVYKLFLNLLAS